MRFPPPPLFESEQQSTWGSDPASPAVARAEAMLRVISEPIIDLKQVCRIARKGVSEKLRADYWRVMIGYFPPIRDDWAKLRERKAVEFMDIVRSVCRMDTDGLTIMTGKDVHRVDVDIPRTMPSLHFFGCEDTEIVDGTPVSFSPTQQSLRRILHTLARVNKGFGYVQGMNELVGHLLFTFADGKASQVTLEVEADTFFCFQSMLSILGDNFCRSLDFDRETGVTSTMRTFDRLFEFCDPELWEHVTGTMQVRPEFYAFRWLTLLFTQEFLVPDVLRIWDYLLSYGPKMSAALFFCAIAMLIHQRSELLAMNSMSQSLPFLQNFPPVDIDELLELTQRLMDEYGIDKIRKLKEADSECSSAAESSAGSSPTTAGAPQLLGSLVSTMRGWGKSLSGIQFKSPLHKKSGADESNASRE